MSSNSQGGGSAFQGRHPDLWYFDQLPPTARQALANADFNWASGAFFNRWRRGERGFKTGAQVADRVAEWDEIQFERERKRRERGRV